MSKETLRLAVQAAMQGDWDVSHNIAQEHSDPLANWLHAVLHKIEGDVWNSKYWYARTTGRQYTDFTDAHEELAAIQKALA